jgi:multidrug efflux system outer membrane protein
MRLTATAAIAACVLFAGCMTGPDYERPAIDAPALFQYATAAAVVTADAAWWKAFGDPVLDALVAEALVHNDNVRIAVANLEQAAAVFTQSRSQLFPQIGYDASAARSRSPQPGLPPEVARLIPNPDDAYRAGL